MNEIKIVGAHMALHPLGARIVAEPVEPETTSPAGILLPDQAKGKTQVAEVTAVGKDVKEVKVGDRIVHSEYGPDRFKQDGKELLILKEEDVLAVVKGK